MLGWWLLIAYLVIGAFVARWVAACLARSDQSRKVELTDSEYARIVVIRMVLWPMYLICYGLFGSLLRVRRR